MTEKMNLRLLGVLLSLVSLSVPAAWASERSGNEGPQGAPQPMRPLVLAELVITPGFMMPHPVSTQIQIFITGEVRFVTTELIGGSTRTTGLMSLSPSSLARLRATIDAIQPAALVDLQADQPRCMDAPGMFYSVNQAGGGKVEIADWSSCHESAMANGQGVSVKRLLDRIRDLPQLAGGSGRAVLPPNAAVMAEFWSGGGFAPTPISQGIRIRADGQALKWTRTGSVQYEEVVATFSPAVTARLAANIDAILPSVLVDTQPASPRCADAPGASFKVTPAHSSVPIEIGAERDCHEYLPADDQGGAIREVLELLRLL